MDCKIRFITTQMHNQYPLPFNQAKGEKIVRVISCRIFNPDGQEDIAITLHADFAVEAYNYYDGFVTFSNHYFREHDFIVRNPTQFFNVWFKVLSDEPFDFTGWRFVLELELLYNQY